MRTASEEAGHADQQILVQHLEFLRVRAQAFRVVQQRRDTVQQHAPINAPPDGGGSVQREVHAPDIVEQTQDAPEAVFFRAQASVRFGAPRDGGHRWWTFRFGQVCGFWRVGQVRLACHAREFGSDPLGWQHKIHHSGGDSAVRHRTETGRGLILREGDPALTFDRLETQRAVRGRARENHADGAVTLILGQGPQEIIYGPVLAASHRARREPQASALDHQIGVRRDHVNVICFDAGAVRNLRDRQAGGAGQQCGQ
jgi:hypothetical protein